jgi:hypothetical protein
MMLFRLEKFYSVKLKWIMTMNVFDNTRKSAISAHILNDICDI